MIEMQTVADDGDSFWFVTTAYCWLYSVGQKVWLPLPTCRGALSENAALAMPRLAHISGRAAWQRSSD